MQRQRAMIFLALAFALCTAGVAPAADYRVTDLGISCPTQGTVYGSYPMSVNDSGQVVGYISVTTATNGPARRAAYYSGGQWIDIGDALAPGDGITAGSGVESMATCINDNALVSGWWGSTNSLTGSCYTYQIGAGSYTYPSNASGVLNYGNTGATHSMTGGAITDSGWKKWTCGGGLNSSGTLAGCYNDGTNEWGFTFSRSSSSTIPFSSGYTLEVTGDNYVAGISNAGVIVTHSQLLYNGGELPFNDPAFYVTTDGVWHSLPIFTPESIAGNFVVGSSAAEDPFAVNNTYGQICTLGATTATNLVLSGDAWSLATGVSTNGIAVGVSDSAGVISSVQEGTIDTTQRAFVYNGSATVSLNSLAVGANPFANLQAATSISNNGEYIVGYGPVNGVLHGFLLTAALPGDANLDGRVDVNDLTIVLSHFGQSGMGWSQGEFTGDGMVDVNDLTIVLSQFGQGLSAPSAGIGAVPEPGALATLVAGLAGLLAYAWLPSRAVPRTS